MRDSRHRRGMRRPTPALPVTNARQLAFTVLDASKSTTEFVGTLFDQRAARSGIADNDRRLAREIVLGAVRRQATLAALIEPHVSRPRHQIEDPLWTLLQIGAYQLTFMDSVPAHAAVDETVETARRIGKAQWCGLLNGVLRALAKSLTAEMVETPAADAIPIAAGKYRKCTRAFFPDPATDPRGYFARAFSFPDWLAVRWRQRFDFDELCRLGFWFNQPPRLCLRVNTLRTTRAKLIDALSAAGIGAHPGAIDEAVWLDVSARVESLPGYREGWFVVQDETAMAAAQLLAPRPGERVLDLCAAPGTKTTHLAQLMNNEGTIVATDIRAERLERVTENAARLGIEIIEPVLIRGDGDDVLAGPFDAVLVDVPCSNTGVLAKRPEARWRLQTRDLDELTTLQQRLLSLAVSQLKAGGRLVYSTCSIEPEENTQVVAAVVERHPGLRVSAENKFDPGRPGDGGYQALIVETGGSEIVR